MSSRTLWLLTVLALAACGDSSGTAGQGGNGDGGSPNDGGGPSDGGGGSLAECVVVDVSTLEMGAGQGDYNYSAGTSGSGSSDTVLLELYDGLDTPDVDIGSDSKNGKPSTCEACGWYFEDGSDVDAARIFFHETGSIALDVPNFGDELATTPDGGTLTSIVYREVVLEDPQDLYSADFVPGGACVRLESATF